MNQSTQTGRHDNMVQSIALGGRIIEDHSPHGILYEALPVNKKWKERQRRNRHCGHRSHYDVDDHHQEGENYPPQVTVLESHIRNRNLRDLLHDNFCEEGIITCEGTMYRHTSFSWEDTPVTFKDAHDIVIPSDHYFLFSGKNSSICYGNEQQNMEILSLEQTVRYLTTLECHVYNEIIWMKCQACHDADERFRQWVWERLNHETADTSANDADVTTFVSNKRKRKCRAELEWCHHDAFSSNHDMEMINNGRWGETKVPKTSFHNDMIVD